MYERISAPRLMEFNEIKTIGIVKWLKGRFKDLLFEEGIEFVNKPGQAILQLEECISRGVDIHHSSDNK
jgi:hypothetical protein